MEAALQVNNLTKVFRGRTKALDGLTLTVPTGSLCAFVGANGAGKTTTFSLVGGFLRPTSGDITVLGKRVHRMRGARGRVGILPQDMHFFEDRTVRSQLVLFGKLSGLSSLDASLEADRVLARVGLKEKARARAGELSRGMRVRLGVAQALIGKPPLLLLDEPMAGLDPINRSQVKDLMLSLKGNTTVMVSSHELGELQTFCDYICAIDRGKCLFSGKLDEVLDGGGDEFVTYHLGYEPRGLHDLKKCLLEEQRVTTDEANLSVRCGGESVEELNQRVLSWLVERRVPVHEVTHRKSLEETYLTFLKDLEHQEDTGRQ